MKKENELSFLNALLDSQRIIITAGAGGVGKTTTAAAIALAGAMRGKRVLCMTIDPAKRLAESLGLGAMSREAELVQPARFEAAGVHVPGTLTCLMLDPKTTFDDLITRNAASPEHAARILENKIYRVLSTELAGTQEYMAMEKLLSVRESGLYDLIVLDTPPTPNALDFLEAPDRMAGLVDSPAVAWLVESFKSKKTFSLNVLARGAQAAMKAVASITGAGMLESLAELLSELNSMLGGFGQRAERLRGVMRAPETSFVIVTAPRQDRLAEAQYFYEKVQQFGMRCEGLVVNRVHLAESAADTDGLADALVCTPEEREALRAAVGLRRALADSDAQALGSAAHWARVPQLQIPEFSQDVYDIRALADVATRLTA